MEKYEVSVFNTITKQYEMVEVSKEVYEVYKRTEWREEKADATCAIRQIPISSLIGGEFGLENFHEYVEMCEDIQNQEEELEDLKARVASAMEKLDQDEKELIQALFFDELSEKEYAALLNISQPAVHKRKVKILAKLKGILAEK